MGKYDIKRACRPLYTAPAAGFALIDVPPLHYFMVDGAGDPNTAPDYLDAVEALFTAAYTLKFISKGQGSDYVVPPLEGLWWAEDMADFVERRKHRWRWTMMIVTPPFLEPPVAQEAIEAARRRKPRPALSELRFEALTEGLAVQTLHVGAYDDEAPILQQLHRDLLPAQGLRPTGHHHEIYLSDPRRTQAAKLKTILRQPVRRELGGAPS